MAATVFKGDTLLVYLDGVEIELQNECTLTATSDMIETTTKSSAGAKTFIGGDYGWTISCSGLADIADSSETNVIDFLTALKAGTVVLLGIGVSGGKYFTGSGLVSNCTVEGPRNGTASFSADFQGSGVLTLEDTNPS